MTQTRNPNVLRCLRLGRLPFQDSNGVFFVRLWQPRLSKNAACTRAEDQYITGRPAPYRRESSDLCEGSIKPFNAAILDCYIWAGWFNDVVMIRQLLAKGMGTCKFAAKVGTNHNTCWNSVFLQEQIYQVDRRMFRTARTNPSLPCEVIDYDKVRIESIK